MKKILISLVLITHIFSCSKNENTESVVVPQTTSGTWTDVRDGKEYKTIIINDQEWMAENFAYRLPFGTLDGVFTFKEKIADTMAVDIPKSEIHRLMFELDVNKRFTKVNMRDMFYLIYEMYGFKDYFVLNPRAPELYEMSWVDMVADEYNPMFYDPELVAYMMNIDAILHSAYVTEAIMKNVDKNYAAEYGNLYSYDAIKRSIPEGWRLPSDEDWKKLEISLGMSLDDTNLENEWRGNGQGDLLADKEFGFGLNYGGSYIAGQMADMISNFQYLGCKTTFWSSSVIELESDTLSMTRSFMKSNDRIYRGKTDLNSSLNCVRLIRDKK